MSLNRRRFLGAVGIALCSGVGGCLSGSGDAETTATESDRQATVTIRDGEFSPASLEADAGGAVTVAFVNHDDREHVLQGDFDGFEVRVPADETVSREVTVPDRPGDYEINCNATTGPFTLEAVPGDLMGGCSRADGDE